MRLSGALCVYWGTTGGCQSIPMYSGCHWLFPHSVLMLFIFDDSGIYIDKKEYTQSVQVDIETLQEQSEDCLAFENFTRVG